LAQPPFLLDGLQRGVVDAAIRDECRHEGWVLHAVHVRTNHVHVVLTGTTPAGRMLNQLKSWATRRLREASLLDASTRPWSRHGSTVPLPTPEAVEAACHYVIHRQGPPLPTPTPPPASPPAAASPRAASPRSPPVVASPPVPPRGSPPAPPPASLPVVASPPTLPRGSPPAAPPASPTTSPTDSRDRQGAATRP
jgi:hypothetical protein